jgi:hypothetical protein
VGVGCGSAALAPLAHRAAHDDTRTVAQARELLKHLQRGVLAHAAHAHEVLHERVAVHRRPGGSACIPIAPPVLLLLLLRAVVPATALAARRWHGCGFGLLLLLLLLLLMVAVVPALLLPSATALAAASTIEGRRVCARRGARASVRACVLWAQW